MSDDPVADLLAAIETIETSYEHMLAYAARGRDDEVSGESPSIRDSLGEFELALERIGGLAEAASLVHDGAFEGFVDALGRDADRARSAIRMTLAVPALGSQLVDNLNASTHLRTVITDLFLLDEILKAWRRGPRPANR